MCLLQIDEVTLGGPQWDLIPEKYVSLSSQWREINLFFVLSCLNFAMNCMFLIKLCNDKATHPILALLMLYIR